MKVLRVFALMLVAVHLAMADDPFAESNTLLSAATQHHQPSSVPPYTLAQLQEIAMRNNPEIRIAVRRLSVAQSRASGAGALDDPTFMYRDWGTPLKKPWDLNQAQNMFMYSQTLPGPGKRGLRSEIAGKEVEVARAELEAVRRDISVRVSRAFYDLLRNNDELRIHDEQVMIARQALETARIKYTVGRVPQQATLGMNTGSRTRKRWITLTFSSADRRRWAGRSSGRTSGTRAKNFLRPRCDWPATIDHQPCRDPGAAYRYTRPSF
jgi:outer membrane protein, heavy metal efflux system